MGAYLARVGTALSQLLNAVILGGDPKQTVSFRVGRSMLSGGWAARVPWPGFMRDHWLEAALTRPGR